MVRIDGTSLEVSCGDTAAFTLAFEGDVPADGTVALVTIKRSARQEAPVLEKRLEVLAGQVSVVLTSADTALPFGAYQWDVRLLMDGRVVTPLPPQPFKVVEVIGRAE